MLIKPKKSLGQNFLHNPKMLDRIVAAGEITKEDVVLEVGPGTGNLTKKLSEKAGRVLAIEKDGRVIKQLQEEFRGQNVEIIEDDVLKLKTENWKLETGNYKIIGNIPYYITSNFLRTVFEKWPQPELIILMVQKEVAQRIAAKSSKMNLLALSVQYFSEPKIISYISKGNFFPVPKIDSAIIKLKPKPADRGEAKKFLKLARLGFEGKRKQLLGNLSKRLNVGRDKLEKIFEELKIPKTARPEMLTIGDWIKLADKIT